MTCRTCNNSCTCKKKKCSTEKWQLVEHAGGANERLVSEWDSFDDAYCAKHENYTPEEQMELNIDILKNWSTEY